MNDIMDLGLILLYNIALNFIQFNKMGYHKVNKDYCIMIIHNETRTI